MASEPHPANEPTYEELAFRLAESERKRRLLVEECKAARDGRLHELNHNYAGACPHCIANARLSAARAATDAGNAMVFP